MELTTTNVALLVSLLIVAVVIIAIVGVRYVKTKGLDGIRNDVYHLFLEAEHRYKHGENEEKLQWVCEKAYPFLPKPVQFFVTPKTLKTIIDAWFTGVKDLLDDGKLNGSSKEPK